MLMMVGQRCRVTNAAGGSLLSLRRGTADGERGNCGNASRGNHPDPHSGATGANLSQRPAAAVVSGLPLLTKPLKTRVRLINDAFALMGSDSPFIQFTYAMTPPIPKRLARVRSEASERIWLNIPPAKVWVYRKA